jgi:hypothetical protein
MLSGASGRGWEAPRLNERQGDQLLLRDGVKVGAWGRVFGQQTREHFGQGAQPDFDGTYAGRCWRRLGRRWNRRAQEPTVLRPWRHAAAEEEVVERPCGDGTKLG